MVFYPSNIKVTNALDDLQHIKVEKHRSHKELHTVGGRGIENSKETKYNSNN